MCDHGSKKKCFAIEEEGGIKEEGKKVGYSNERGCSHTSHFLFSIISFKPDNSESNLSEHVCEYVCTVLVFVHYLCVCVCDREAREAFGCVSWTHLREL